MSENYFRADDSDGTEYGRSASLLDGMEEALTQMPAVAAAGSPINQLDHAFPGAPVAPSVLLRNAMDHTLVGLSHVMGVAEQCGRKVCVPAVMSNIRTSLLAASHLCYVTSPPDPHERLLHMGELYHLESASARGFVGQLDGQKQNPSLLAGLRPPLNTAVRQLASYTNPYPPPRQRRVSESSLLTHMKQQVLGPLMAQRHVNESVAALTVDHLFNTTSGAAHGYGWINLDGVICHFVTQFSSAVMVANIVFNDYLRALGHHPSQGLTSPSPPIAPRARTHERCRDRP